jgi:putative endonuclease
MKNSYLSGSGGWNPPEKFWYVYILECGDGTHYTGCTSDLENRLNRHTIGQVDYTRTRLPIKLLFHACFQDKYKAYEFEKYLKSGSGSAFAKKH